MSLDFEDIDILDPPESSMKKLSPKIPGPLLTSHRSAPVSTKDKIFFYSSLSRLLTGGVPVLKALDLISRQRSSGDFGQTLSAISRSIKEGASLSRAQSDFPAFKAYEISVVKAGEISGTLTECLSRLGKELQRQEEIRSKVKEAVAYPLFVLSMGIVSLFLVLLFVVPKLSLLYKEMGGQLPFITRIVITVSDAAPWALAAIALVTAALVLRFKKDPTCFDSITGKIPLVRDISKKLRLSRLSLLLSTLLQSGIPVREAVSICRDSFPQNKKEISQLHSEISQGRGIAESFRHLPFFGENEIALLSASEESGMLAESLAEIAEDASKEMASKVAVLLKILEPVLILLIGLVVGFLVAGMILPITEIDLLAGE